MVYIEDILSVICKLLKRQSYVMSNICDKISFMFFLTSRLVHEIEP